MGTTDDRRERRADPDALLALAGKPGRGRLTVFLGAAPGVGKTYAMLTRARRLKAEGVDVVIGIAETHGRSETADLLDGLEIIPRRAVDYKDRTIEEFDLDAALARRPRILVVDELAHSNAPGSRHPKRFQDIEELLTSGIDVWTALNIQHVESVSDVAANITGAPIRELLPDTVLKHADDVILIDLPPTELIERLAAGKVYVPENARRAADGYFRLGNLTALRDLALRRTADRVDDQVVDYLKQNAIEGPWLSAERLLVCIGPDGLSDKVVRTASRLASGLNAHWLVVSIERTASALSPEAGRRLDQTFQLAERLGAETRRIRGRDFVEEILKLARREHATQIVIGARRRPLLSRLFAQSLPDAVMDRAAGIGVHVVTGDPQSVKDRTVWAPRPVSRLVLDASVAVATTAVATLFGLAIETAVDLPNVSILYLVAVLVSATTRGYFGAILASVLSALAYNFFFIDPIDTFTIAQPHEVVALATFLVAAVLGGAMASRLREQVDISGARARETQLLYDFSRKLSGTVKAEDVDWVIVSQLHAALGLPVALLLADRAELRVSAIWPPDGELGVTEMAAARWAQEKGEPAGNGTGTLPNSRYRFLPMPAPHGIVGVLGVDVGGGSLDAAAERTLSAILDQAVVAIDRSRLSRESLEQAAALEGGRFRSALLASVSHDLKTPLATITGAVTSLRQLGDRMSAKSRDDLLSSIEEEGGRLTRFLANLLDMTRIDSKTVEARRDWVDVADVVRSAANQAHKTFPSLAIDLKLADVLPLIRGDSILLGQVLFNLLDNARKFGGAEPVTIYARAEKDAVMISVVDLGKGIAPKDRERIFEKFFRRVRSDGRAPGTGLGLAIARGFVEAMGGTIRVESPAVKRRGTRFVLRFPVEPQPEPPP
jgi:two-component system sensor histidine kinase KdpD